MNYLVPAFSGVLNFTLSALCNSNSDSFDRNIFFLPVFFVLNDLRGICAALGLKCLKSLRWIIH